MSTEGSTKAILAALAANAGIAAAKFVGYFITGSSSMLAEAVHSVADTSNQGLLLFGQREARKEPDSLHQFGYGRSRYFYSFVVALVLFSLGSIFALYEGYHKISHPAPLTSPLVAIVILVVAIGLESFSFRTAMVESRPLKGKSSWWQFIRRSRSPELPVVLLEDTGALIGLVFALAGVGLTVLTDNPVWDGIGTALIGVLLGVIAVILMVEMHSLLIGEGPRPTNAGPFGMHWSRPPISTGSFTCARSTSARRRCSSEPRSRWPRGLIWPRSLPQSMRPRPPYARWCPRRRSSIWSPIWIARWRGSPPPTPMTVACSRYAIPPGCPSPTT